ncbi:GNAT family N-acetyltransferase [Maridesulfovibrio sp.]|uniref:GNAT family N-acetyltransferase n=1 Tax=Maridesulfovibrio sp. TaxID=2795000 RepID=UPI0029F47684|nr:GNAT family N-acetyltransferase [Maridesulfovibrio sp.]
MLITDVSKNDYDELIQVWENSVQATHEFLSEEDINFLRPLILEQYFDAVTLKCVRNDFGEILGFCGIADGNLEMLFIRPESRGQGIGSTLCRYAITQLGVDKVDVNEQNPKALGFYEHIGFKVVGRSEFDGQGKPFPLLHLELDV